MFNVTRIMSGKQKGFTLIETLLALSITAIISGVLIVITTQLFAVNNSNSARLTAVMQVDNAVDAITRDAVQAKTISVNTPGDFLYATWTDYGTGNSYTVVYTIDSAAKTLKRSQNGGTAVIIATNIDVTPANTWCSLNSSTLTLNITSTVTGSRPASETRQVQILQRPT